MGLSDLIKLEWFLQTLRIVSQAKVRWTSTQKKLRRASPMLMAQLSKATQRKQFSQVKTGPAKAHRNPVSRLGSLLTTVSASQ